MKIKTLAAAGAVLALTAVLTQASPLGTAFTYQGRLTDGGNPANGSYDLKLILYDDASGGNAVSGPLTNSPVGVTNGLFNVALDFGPGVFTGDARWLEIAVRTNGSTGDFTLLNPRQETGPVPYALYTPAAGSAGSASNLLGTLPDAQLSTNVARLSASQTFTGVNAFNNAGNAFTGGGTGLTGLNADNVSSGTLSDARLNANVARLNAGQTFTGANTFNNAANVFTGNGAALTGLNADNLATGTLPNARLAGTYSSALTFNNVANSLTGNGSGLTSLNASSLASGTVPSARLSGTYSSALTFNSAANSFTGNGAGLTSLNASSLASGTVPSAQLSGTYSSALTFNNVGNSFSGSGAGLTGVNATTLDGIDSMSFQRSDASDNYTAGTLTFNVGTTLDVQGTTRLGTAVVKTGTGVVTNFNADWLDGLDSTSFWKLAGNSGTTPGTHFLGTTDNQAMELKVNSGRALRLEPNATSPNVIGGHAANAVTAGFYGATIAGGGDSGEPNRVAAYYGTVGGGTSNTVAGPYAVIAGGEYNTIQSSGYYSAISGGLLNNIKTDAYYCNVAGGWYNSIAIGCNYSAIGGGTENTNAADSAAATIGGGGNNLIQTNTEGCTISGGWGNTVKASALYATVPGGNNNTAAGSYSLAAGRQAKANHLGSFVWGDSQAADVASTANNQFIVRAAGGVWFGTTSSPTNPVGRFINTSTGGYLSTGGMWTDSSDANAKENFRPTDVQQILARVAALPVRTWNYKAEDDSVRHLGPVAQDFHAAFGVGEDDQHLAALDSSGVALAAIQGLNQKLTDELNRRDAESAELKKTLNELRETVVKLVNQRNGGAQ